MIDSSDKHWVIVGLGNPGKKYELTRHNLGYLVIQDLAQANGWVLKEEKQFNAEVVKIKVDETIVHLLLPTTYMNLSGQAVRRYLDFFKLTAANIIVVADDLDLPFGQMRLRRMGSPGGHNGLKSIEAYLGTREYVRLRIGIGQDKPIESLADYVLDTFNQEEKQKLPEIIFEGVTALKRLLHEPVLHVMNTVNIKK